MIYQSYNHENWGIIEQYFKDGVEHISLMDFVCPWSKCYGTDEKDEDNLERFFLHKIGKTYFDHLTYSFSPCERVEGFVYGGIRIKRTPDLTTEQLQEFLKIEEAIHSYPDEDNKGYIREIWKYYFTQTWRDIKSYTEPLDGQGVFHVEK